LLIAGKTPREWSELNVGFSISFRTSQQPVFSFDKNKLGALNQNFFNGPFVVELKEDCVLNNDYGTVKAFAAYSDAVGGSTKLCGSEDLTLKQDRAEGPFYYEGLQGGMLQIKMWFHSSVIQANGTSDVNIDIDKMEGLQHALYFNGKSLSEWALEGALGTVTARSAGGFIFRFDPAKYDYSKEYFIEIKDEVQTTKGLVQPFKYSVKAGLTFGNFYDSNGNPTGNGTLIVTKPLTLKQDRAEGPFFYEGVNSGLLQVKMWFAEAVIAANGAADTNITIDKMEGLENKLYFNGKTLAEWNAEGALGTITARSAGGFIFRFNTTKFDTSKAYLIEIKEEVQTTKGVVQPFAYWVKPGLTFGNFFNGDGSATGNGYVYQDKTFEFAQTAFELKVNDTNLLKMWFTDGTATAPVISGDNGEGFAASVTHLEGLESALKIDGKTIAEWETLLGDGFSMGSRAKDGRFTPYFNITALGENNFIGKNFAVELENDCMTSQGVVKAFKYVYNWAMGEGVLNPTEESVNYASADFFHNAEEFFYFDVTFDKAIVKTAPTIDMPLSNDGLQKADLNNLVKINGKDMATTMSYIHVVKDKTDTLRFSVKNEEKSHNFNFTLSAGYVFPNGNVLAEDITLYYNEQNGTWQTTAMPAITIVYNANGGEGTMVGETVAYGSDYVLPANTFTKQGYEFAGWAWTADAKVRFQDQENIHVYVGGALENVNDATLELYAIWQKERGVRFMSISMAGDIGLNFYVDLDEATEATATISMKGEETTVVGVYQEKLACWKFTYGVAPKDYQETVSIEVEDVTAEYSVAQYGMDLPSDNAAYAIVSELMDYCEAARIYFAGEEATETEDLTADLTEYQATVEGEEEGVTIAGATLVLESKTTINVYVTAEDLEGIACTVDGESVTPVAVENQDGQYVISIKGIVSKDLDKTYTITIGGYTITYSALSYVEETLADVKTGASLENLVKALYSLSVEAEKYFA
ncbi:MAG: InlB B-repeat-containing protein, partial [Clostridia bacterium]|nr:InlB B-repeat-containing protein [Clostridia bacterium]